MLPTFLIPGAQKSGTTALRIYLGQHPDIYMADRELHFFDVDANFARGVAWYERFFAGREEEKTAGEKTVEYLYHPEAPERIHSIVPDVKLIFLFRNPVERAYSHYWHHVRRGWEPRSFDEAVRMEEREENPPGYKERGKYARYVKRYAALFPRDRMLFLLTEDLKERTEETLQRVLDFLDVDTSFEFSDLERKNVGGVPRSRLLARLGGHPLVRRFRLLKDAIVRLNTKKGATPPMQPETREYLTEYFRSYNEELQSIARLDLSPWR